MNRRGFNIIGMEQRYAGDDAWNDLVDAFNGIYSESDIDILTNKMDGKRDFAIVINGKIGLNGSLEWSERKIKMLGDLRPVDCLKEAHLIKRLREYLIELPC